MTHYLVAIHHPDDYDPSLEDGAMHRDIDTLNEEMVASGVMRHTHQERKPPSSTRAWPFI